MSLSLKVAKLARRQQPAQFSELMQISIEIKYLEAIKNEIEIILDWDITEHKGTLPSWETLLHNLAKSENY